MIYSRSAEYAIRSFVYLARIPDGKFAMARHIAAGQGNGQSLRLNGRCTGKAEFGDAAFNGFRNL